FGGGRDLLGLDLVLLRRARLGWCGRLLRCELRRGHRLELRVGRQLAALGNDEGLDLDAHVLEDVDRHLVAADALDVLQVDLATVDADLARAPDLVRDVRRRDRAEERAGRARLHLEAEHGLAQRLRDRLRLLGVRGLVPRAQCLTLVQLGDTRGARLLCELPREQEIACVAARDRDDLSAQPELVDVFEQDDVHQRSLSLSPRSRRPPPRSRSSWPSATYGRSAISRARLTACATWT